MIFNSLLIANRGEIACRIIKTAKEMGIRSIAVYVDADKDALFVGEADQSVRLEDGGYLDGNQIINSSYYGTDEYDSDSDDDFQSAWAKRTRSRIETLSANLRISELRMRSRSLYSCCGRR